MLESDEFSRLFIVCSGTGSSFHASVGQPVLPRNAQKGRVPFRQCYDVLNQPLIFSRLTHHVLLLRNSFWPIKQPQCVHFPIFSSKRTRHSREGMLAKKNREAIEHEWAITERD
jgi:hypothetical protein